MNEIFLFKSKIRQTSDGKPVWMRCTTESAAKAMGDSYEIRKVVFQGAVPHPKIKDTISVLDDDETPNKKKRDGSEGTESGTTGTATGTATGNAGNAVDSQGSQGSGSSSLFWDGVDA